MAEPLGAAASILALLDVCAKIEYIQEMKDGSSERTRLMMEIFSTKGILDSLITTVKSVEAAPEAWSETIRFINRKRGPLDLLQEVLTALHGELGRAAPAERVERVRKSPLRPFEKNYVEERLKVIDRQKLLLTLALDNDHVALSREIQSDTRAIRGDVAAIRAGIETQDCEQQPSRPTPTSVLLEPEPESDRAASRTTDQAKPTAEYIPATIHQTSELVRTGSSIFTPNEFRNRASDSPRDDEASSEYCYSPLLEQGSIRLLRLMPHEDEKAVIQCQLFEYPLQKLGEGTHLYEALSYAWGSKQDRQSENNQNNCELSVRGNLHAALSSLRDRYMERIIWIDAICINQKDNDEKGRQVQSMAKIYAKSSRVIVWLGEAAENSGCALKAVCRTAEERDTKSAIYKTHQQTTLAPSDQQPTNSEINQQAILTLLEREWFQRIWEVAAARHVLIKCGPTEIDGYAFCSGLNALNLSYETRPHLQGLIPPILCLIRGAVFRPRYEGDETSRQDRFSLDIRPLSELVDMYHARKTTEPLDKAYALLGMSSDDPSAAGLSANYKSSWKEVFRKLVNFSLSDRVSVYTWDEKEVAVIKGNGCILGEVSSVQRHNRRDDRQIVSITWKNAPSHFDAKGKQSSHFAFQASAIPIQIGDAVYLLQGASKPTIVRLCNEYSAVIMISVPLTDAPQTTSFKWSELLRSITAFPNILLLVWDWDASRGKSHYGEGYEYFMSSRGVPKCPRTELQEATRLWNFGLLLHEMERYEEAVKNLQKAMEVYETALRSVDNSYLGHGPRRKADVEGMVDLLIEDKSGYVPLSSAARMGHKAIVEQLLATGRVDPDSKDSRYGRTPLMWAAGQGHEAVVRLLLEKGAAADTEDEDGRTPLSYAAASGHEAVVKLLESHTAKFP